MGLLNAPLGKIGRLMAVYEFKCDGCGRFFSWEASIDAYELIRDQPVRDIECSENGVFRRTYTGFSFTMPLADGFSPATGTYVSGNRNLKEQFKIASEQATERTGIPHNFQPVDMRDTETLGITEEGLADDNRTRHDRGEPVVTAPGLDV